MRLLSFYLLPLLIMAVCYSIMGAKLWASEGIGEQVQNRNRQIQAKKKVNHFIVGHMYHCQRCASYFIQVNSA